VRHGGDRQPKRELEAGNGPSSAPEKAMQPCVRERRQTVSIHVPFNDRFSCFSVSLYGPLAALLQQCRVSSTQFPPTAYPPAGSTLLRHRVGPVPSDHAAAPHGCVPGCGRWFQQSMPPQSVGGGNRIRPWQRCRQKLVWHRFQQRPRSR